MENFIFLCSVVYPTHLVLMGQMTNQASKKLNPFLIRLFDDNKEKVSAQLLDMGACKEGTTEALFSNMDSILRENKVDWANCVDVGLGNTAMNVAKRNSIMTRVLTKSKNIFLNGWPCHIIYKTANKAAEQFSEKSGFGVEDIPVELFPCFDKSSKRKVTSNF